MDAKQLQSKILQDMGLHNPAPHSRRRVESFLEDLDTETPIDCPFDVGDNVMFTNEYGVKFDSRVLGFVKPSSLENYTSGRKVFLAKESYWFPVPITSLEKI